MQNISESNRTAIVLLDNAFYMHNKDEWDSFRNEGRLPLNIAFGISLLGYDVDIAYHGWDSKPKTTWNNIRLVKSFIRDYYDVALSFSTYHPLSGLKFGKGISIVYEKSHIDRTNAYIKATGNEIRFATTYKDIVNSMKQTIGKDVYYLPPLYPIPSISIGFPAPSYDPKLPELKVYMHYTSWPQNTTISGDRFRTKEQLIIDHLRAKGYRVKLSLLVASRSEPCPIRNEDLTYHYSPECSYRDILDLITSADICVTAGASVFPGSGMTDIITLGKPLIYIGDGKPRDEVQNVNLLYKIPENIIYLHESEEESMRKIDVIMSDPVGFARRYADVHRDQNFDNWKKIVTTQGIF